MAVSDYSTTPLSNGSISGISIAEGCAAGNVNNAFRQIMADVKVFYNAVPTDFSVYMQKGGGAFTGPISLQGHGAYLQHDDSSNGSGRVFVQAAGGTVPAMSNGDILIEY